jgi:DNA-binding YbaB/EbfC family protein
VSQPACDDVHHGAARSYACGLWNPGAGLPDSRIGSNTNRSIFFGENTMMKGQIAGLMKQAQAMQDNLKRAQDELATMEVEGQSGAGLVKITMTCKHDVRRVTIDPSLLADDKDMLEDLVAAAFNDGLRKAEAVSSEKMGKLTAGMPMPPGMKFPF